MPSLAALKLSLKLLARRKAYTAISLFGIALTLVVLVLVAAVIDAQMGSNPPQPHADRTLLITQVRVEQPGGRSTGPLGGDFVDRVARDLPGAEEVAVVSGGNDVDAWAGDREVALDLRFADAAYWRIHEYDFVEGSAYGDEDVEQGRAVIVLSESAARRAFGDPPWVGREIEVRSRSHRVCGVVRDVSVMLMIAHADAWLPVSHVRAEALTGLQGSFIAVILARTKGDLPRLRREIAARVAAIPMEPEQVLKAHADTYESAAARAMLPAHEDGTAAVGQLRGLLAAGIAAFLALPVLNLVNLSLSRMTERSTEIGVRKAFGATPWRLLVQFVGENVVLVLAGGLLALAATPLVLRAIDAWGLLPGARLRMDAGLFGTGLLIAVAFGVLSGAWPAWRMSRWAPVDSLRGRIG